MKMDYFLQLIGQIDATLNWNGLERINLNGETDYMSAEEYDIVMLPPVGGSG